MNANHYQPLALRTEAAPPTGQPGSPAYAEMVDALCAIAVYGDQLDKVKKHLFYGRPYKSDDLSSCGFSVNNLGGPGRPWGGVEWRLAHGLLGKASELAELAAVLVPYLADGGSLDVVNVGEEIGDSRWYDAVIADALGLKLGDIDATNIEKLEVRFGGRFTPEQANMRDFLAEREALEAGTKLPYGPDDFSELEVLCMARAAHEANRAYCFATGDNSQPAWDDAPDWQRNSALVGVDGVLRGNGPRESHALWLTEKVRTGWTYGPVKDPERKTHPCFLPYDELPPAQRAKDTVFVTTVRAMAEALLAARGSAP